MIETISENTDENENSKNNVQIHTFDEALVETRFGKFNYGFLFACGIILASSFIETVGISYVLPIAQCDIQLTTQEKGIVNSIGFIGIILSSHLWGFLADTCGRRKIMAPALFIGFVIGVVSSFYKNFWMLTTLRFLNCFFVSAGSATIYAYIGEFHTDKFRGRAIMIASVVFGIGVVFLPLLAWLVLSATWRIEIDALNLSYKPWRLLIVVLAIPDLIGAITLWILPESPQFLFSIGKKTEALNILKTIFHINTGKSKNEYSVCKIKQEENNTQNKTNCEHSSNSKIFLIFNTIWKQTAPLFSNGYLQTTLLAAVMQFMIFFTMQGLYVWFPYILNTLNEFNKMNPNNSTLICNIVYAKQKYLLENNQDTSQFVCQEQFETKTYVSSLILEILYVIGFAVIGLLINILGKLPILFTILIICGVSGLLCNFITSPGVAGYLYVILLLDGLAVPIVNAITVDLYPTNLRAMAVCITLMFGRLGSVVGSNLVGLFLDINCDLTFYISGISLIITAFLGYLVPKKQMDLTTKL